MDVSATGATGVVRPVVRFGPSDIVCRRLAKLDHVGTSASDPALTGDATIFVHVSQ
jgi:hypothetical protein